MSLIETAPPSVKLARTSQFLVMTWVAVAFTLLAFAWSFGDTRTLDGVAVWMKPLKFSLSFAILFGTLALIETRLTDTSRDGWTLRVTGWIMAAAFLSEMAYITYQAALAEGSHFNLSTPFHQFMYEVVMAGGAVALVLGVAVVGWVAKRDTDARLSPALREAIWLGCLLSFVLTMIVAGYMSVVQSHHVGVHPTGAPTLPLVGWSGVAGDLRPAHFASLHAMQALPLMALWQERRGQGSNLRTTRVAAASYTFLTIGVFAQGVMGYPLLPLG